MRSVTTSSSWLTCAWTSSPTTVTVGCSTTRAVDNDATLEQYAAVALAQARAGAQVLGLSGMMDGQVGLSGKRWMTTVPDTIILAYAAKYASGFYGPFREAVESTLKGNRATYQQDPANTVRVPA